MTLQTSYQRAQQGLTPNMEALAKRRCRAARQHEKTGDYDGARAALAEFWSGLGERPNVAGLTDRSAGEVIMRAGVLTSCLGYVRQIEGTQEAAKNLLSESQRIFEDLGDVAKVAEAVCEIGLCYWRAGENDNARVMLREAIGRVGDLDDEVKALAVLRLAVVESSASNYHSALNILTENARLFERDDNPSLRGSFHVNLASTLKNLGEIERNSEYTDRALIEYAAARHYFELARHRRYLALVENQLGFLLLNKKDYKEARYHLDRARRLFSALRDRLRTAQVDETRAQLFLAAGKVKDALSSAHSAVRVLERGDAQVPYAEALITLGIAQIRSGSLRPGRASLERAMQVAEINGAHDLLVLAVTTSLEELSEHLQIAETCALFMRARPSLSNVHRIEILMRLCVCASSIVADVAQAGCQSAQPAEARASEVLPGEQVNWESFSLREVRKQVEREWIIRALQEAQGGVSKAANLLGMRHQDLVSIMELRHQDLMAARKPKVVRHRSIIKR